MTRNKAHALQLRTLTVREANLTDIPVDPLPDRVIDRGPEGKGVGRWVPEQKHVLLSAYLEGTRYAWKQWTNRVFIDPFCGPGRLQVEAEPFTRDGGALVAWRQANRGGAPFTKMLVGDLANDRVEACSDRLLALGAPTTKFSGEAVITVKKMIAEIPATKTLSFAYIDPYNLELLSFEIIEAIATLKSVDFAVHFSTMDLQRNVEFEFDPTRARFDGTAPDWRKKIDIRSRNKEGGANAFFEYWCSLVRDLGFKFSEQMPLVRNNRGAPIYRLVFFSRHSLPNRIWGDIAQGPNRSFNF